ncbi:MAG: hypothetical protein DMG93_10065 [Acidobacteria bacterium]|nr:MAG: hypothetical protein DMG93_10065 [Acidobacteriota bacterium]
MRLLSALLMAMILAVSALSQQSNENKEQPKPEAKKTAPEKQSQQPQKPEEAQLKSTDAPSDICERKDTATHRHCRPASH